jgi:hypothetical protein
MPKTSQVYTVFIASPSDLDEERTAIPELINDWNAANGLPNNIIFLPIKWESNSAPQLGERPQEFINRQLVQDCDLLVALFWTRVGQPTGKEESGTIEEIREFMKAGKPALLYFSERPVPPNKIDIDQLSKLKAFRDQVKTEGLIETFSDLYDFKSKFARQLGITISRIVSETTENKTRQTVAKKKIENIKMAASPRLDDAQIKDWLIRTFDASVRDDGTANLTAFAQMLNQYTPFDYKSLGFSKLKVIVYLANTVSLWHKIPRRKSMPCLF